MKPDLNDYLKKLREIFRNNDYRTAHRLCQEHLMAMARDNDILMEVIKRNLSKPGFFSNKRINPVIAFEIEINKHFSIVAHSWMPLPDRSTTTTHQSVHHHGRLLLTSVSPFGPGYESVMFRKGYQLNEDKSTATIHIEKIYRNPLHNIEFVDSFTPHVVFYPDTFSVTYALWSYDKKDGFIASLRRSKFMQSNKKFIIRALRKLGIARSVGVNVLEYFDFYPDNGKIIPMRDRVMYPVGTNENFVNNIFYILQRIGFKDTIFLQNLALSDTEKQSIAAPLQKFLRNESITDTFEPIHLNIPKINFTKEELLKCFN